MPAVRSLRTPILSGILALAVWFALHIPAVNYGTRDLPLHQSYIGDEQSPVNGALHILEDRNLWAFRNLTTVYYGPVFSVVALPAIAADFGIKLMSGAVHGAADYKDLILWDWGGIVRNARSLSVIAGFLALAALYALLMTESVNPERKRGLALLGVVLLAFNFYFFEYSSFFKHWVYVIAGLLWQIYLLVRIIEDREHARRYYVWQGIIFAGTFGLSYVSALSQIIFLPALVRWVRTKDGEMLRAFGTYALCLVIPLLLVFFWHPRAFLRLLNLVGGDISGAGYGNWTTEKPVAGFSFLYYGVLLIKNHLALFALWCILLVNGIRKKYHVSEIFWMPIAAAVLFYAVFGLIGHHEARYVLPVIASIAASAAMLLVWGWEDLWRYAKTASLALIVSYAAFHAVSIFFWEKVMIAGPAERAAIDQALAFEKDHPQARQFFISYYLAGYRHTVSAYLDYAKKFGRADTNLFKAIIDAPPRAGQTPLNVYYIHPDQLASTSVEIASFDRIVYHFEPQKELSLDPDYGETDLTRLWTSPIWRDSFVTIKP